MSTLGLTIAEVGRIIESLPPHERRDAVAAVVSEMTESQRLSFDIGVFCWAHESVRTLRPQPSATVASGSLRERLRDLCSPLPQGHILTETVEHLVVTWLRDKAGQYGDVSLSNLAMYVEDGDA